MPTTRCRPASPRSNGIDRTSPSSRISPTRSEEHRGSTFWLTGANRFAGPGQSFHNSISADQVAAEAFGKDTRFTSLQLSCDNGEESGHGPGLSLAWNRQGKPVAGFNIPVTAFHRLFSEDTTPLEQRQALLKQKRSVLDTVLDDAGSVARGLSKEDTDKLDEYLQSIRDIETRIAKEEQWLDKPKPKPAGAITEPKEGIAGFEEIKAMYDLIVAALQTDATRVISYRQPVDRLIQSLGISFTGHSMSHYTPARAWTSTSFATKSRANCSPTCSTNSRPPLRPHHARLRQQHPEHPLPRRLPHRHRRTRRRREARPAPRPARPEDPAVHLWLTLLRGNGLSVESHGDSTGVIPQLVG